MRDQRGVECQLAERLGLGAEDEDDAGQVDCGEERADDTDNQGGGEALDRTCTEEEEYDTGDDRGQVGVEDGGEGVGITVGDGGAHILACTKFLLGALEDKHVGVNRHTEGKHDTGDTREGQHGLEGGEDSEGEEEVADKSEVGDETGNQTVYNTHENHQQHDGQNE